MRIVFLDAKTVGALSELKQLEDFGEVILYQTTSDRETLKRIRGAEVVITNKVRIDKKVMSASPDLKLICVAATGMNNIDLDEAGRRGIQVKNVKAYSTDSVAQHTFSLLFYQLNHPAYYDKFVKSGKYSRSAMFTSLERDIYELKGKELGIIGLGTIGRKVAEIASVFGANVSYFSTSGRNDDPIYKRKELNDLLRESDIISIHSPLNEETKGLIGENQLKMMKASSIIINTGRGGIIIEKDLVKALNKNWIFSAAVDVFEKEPLPASHPYLKVKNREKLLLTPHIAWASVEARRELLRGIYRNIDTYLKEKK